MSHIINITEAHARGSSITSVAVSGPATTEVAPVRLNRRAWRSLPAHLKGYRKQAVEQALGVMAFHDTLHATNTPHWIERREDGVYLIWGEDAANSAFVPVVCMDAFPVGTRIAG